MPSHIREAFTRGAARARERGASAVEYGLLVAAIAAIIIATIFALGRVVNGAFLDTCKAINATQANPDCTTGAGQ